MRNNIPDSQRLLVLMDIAEGLRVLQSDPKALQKAIKDAYALNETEKKEVEDAREIISSAAQILSDIDLQKKALGDLVAQQAAIEANAKANKEESSALEAAKEALKIISEKQEKIKCDLDKDRMDIERDKAALDQRESDLDGRETNLETAEKAFKDKVKKANQIMAA